MKLALYVLSAAICLLMPFAPAGAQAIAGDAAPAAVSARQCLPAAIAHPVAASESCDDLCEQECSSGSAVSGSCVAGQCVCTGCVPDACNHVCTSMRADGGSCIQDQCVCWG